MNEYFDVIKKHGCDVKIINKNGNDTKINLQSIIEVIKNLESAKAKNEADAKQDLLIMFEELLKERSEV
jgi:hypothetical protein